MNGEKTDDGDKKDEDSAEQTDSGDKTDGESAEQTDSAAKKDGDSAEQTDSVEKKDGESADQTDKKEQEVFVIQDTNFTVEIASPGVEPFELPVSVRFSLSGSCSGDF